MRAAIKKRLFFATINKYSQKVFCETLNSFFTEEQTWHFHGVTLDPIVSFFLAFSFFFFNKQKFPASATTVKPFALDKTMVPLTLLFLCPLDKTGQEYHWTVVTNRSEVMVKSCRDSLTESIWRFNLNSADHQTLAVSRLGDTLSSKEL